MSDSVFKSKKGFDVDFELKQERHGEESWENDCALFAEHCDVSVQRNITPKTPTDVIDAVLSCKLCGKRFLEPFHLAVHLRTHGNVHPHKSDNGESLPRTEHLQTQESYGHTCGASDGIYPTTAKAEPITLICAQPNSSKTTVDDDADASSVDSKFHEVNPHEDIAELPIYWNDAVEVPLSCDSSSEILRKLLCRRQPDRNTPGRPSAVQGAPFCYSTNHPLHGYYYFQSYHSSSGNASTETALSAPFGNIRNYTQQLYPADCVAESSASGNQRNYKPCVIIVSAPEGDRFACSACDSVFTDKSTANDHLDKKHRLRNPYGNRVTDAVETAESSGGNTKSALRNAAIDCSECGKSFKRKAIYLRHLNTHTGYKPHSCGHCLKRFYQKEDLTKHLVSHTNIRNFCCEQCGRRFKTKPNLRCHIIFVHLGHKPFRCKHCPMRLSTRTLLKAHVQVHTGRLFGCTMCKKRYTNSRTLKEHVLLKHSDIHPYGCTVCEMRFKAKKQLETHFREHTGDKPFVCHLCGKVLSRARTLKNHLLTHSDERPLTCHVCQKGFKRRTELNYHLNSHSARNPYACRICGKVLSRPRSFLDHMQRHDSVLSCDCCGKFFYKKSKLVIHVLGYSENMLNT